MKLYKLDNDLKIFLALFLIVLSCGVTIGLIYTYSTTTISTTGITDHYTGSKLIDEFDIPIKYPKPISEMLLTTHNHVISFSFIFLFVGIIFYFNTIITGKIKKFLLIEPLISTILTFSSLWGIRFIDKSFVFITILSSSILYLSFYFIVSILLYELLIKR